MRKFEAPKVEIIVLAVEDIITTSVEFIPPEQGENQTPYG